jgi:hypothetical protein
METIRKIINGVEYTAVWKGYNYTTRRINDCLTKDKKRYSNSKLSAVIFDEIIIDPKVTVDDFDDLQTFNEVLEFGKSVLFGDFEKKSTAKLKTEVLKEEWDYWRLVFCDIANFDYDTVFNQMTPQQVKKANIALDIVNEEINKKSKKKK